MVTNSHFMIVITNQDIGSVKENIYLVYQGNTLYTFFLYKKHAYKKHEAEIWVNQKCYLPKY